MNTTTELLFHLDIPLDYYKKLQNYYYIPENKVVTLKTGGYIFFINKYTPSKNLYYLGILTKIDKDYFCFKDKEPIKINDVLEKFHVFYKPKIAKLDKAIQMLNIINNSTTDN